MGRVLLVDDDRGVLEALAVCFDTQYEIFVAMTGTDALALLRYQTIDVMVLDFRLSDLSGLEVLGRVKESLPWLPVIVMTGYGSESVCASALKLGARDYFIKPFNPADLVSSVEVIMSDVRSLKEGRQPTIATDEAMTGPTLEQSRPVHRDQMAVRRAVRLIQKQYAEKVLLRELARDVGMSKFEFSRKFKALMTLSFRQYLLQFRVRKARELLETSRYSVTEVAQMVGFSDLPRFDKVFKRYVGTSPSGYRTGARQRTIETRALHKTTR